jgi:hypothetical protein
VATELAAELTAIERTRTERDRSVNAMPVHA